MTLCSNQHADTPTRQVNSVLDTRYSLYCSVEDYASHLVDLTSHDNTASFLHIESLETFKMSTPQSASSPTIVSLASQISHLSSQITTYLQSHSYAEPSLSATLPSSIPETDEYNALRAPLNDAAHELLRLINGPKITLRTLVFSHYDLAALQLALDRKFFYHVPLPDAEEGRTDGPLRDTESTKHIATAAEIAEKAGMDEDRTKRVLRLLATHGIFEEVASDSESTIWKHTANSALFTRDEDFYAAADMQMDDLFKAASETSTTIINSPYISNPINSPFHTRFGIPMYQYYEENPKKGARFAQAMDSWSQGKPPSH
jgi:hypothetical protein